MEIVEVVEVGVHFVGSPQFAVDLGKDLLETVTVGADAGQAGCYAF